MEKCPNISSTSLNTFFFFFCLFFFFFFHLLHQILEGMVNSVDPYQTESDLGLHR